MGNLSELLNVARKLNDYCQTIDGLDGWRRIIQGTILHRM